MGFAPGAHLVYGVLLTTHVEDEETYESKPTHPIFDDEERDYDVAGFIAERRKIVNPYKMIPDEVNHGTSAQYEQWRDDHPEWDDQRRAWRQIKMEIEQSSLVEVQQHGHYDDPEGPPTFMVLKGHEFDADAWSPKSISLFDMDVLDVEIETARTYCEENGLPPFDDPTWHLVASYG